MGGELELVSLQHKLNPTNMNIHLLQDFKCEPLYLGQLCNAKTTERVVAYSVDLLCRDSTRDRLYQHTAQKIRHSGTPASGTGCSREIHQFTCSVCMPLLDMCLCAKTPALWMTENE